jgi:hypothetical protein
MRQVQLASNADPSASRKIRRPAITFAAGLIALAIATAVVLDQPSGPTSAGSDPMVSSLVSPSATRVDSGTATASTQSAIDAAKPRFERSDEPASEDSTNAHGG